MTLDHAEHPFTAPPRVSERLRDAGVAHRGAAAESAQRVVREPGRPLDSATRAEMESSFGYDFGNVRVHADDAAAASTRDLDALAYSLGPHVVFGSGQFAPHTSEGRRLLAHELAHCVQQDGARPGAAEPSPEKAGSAALEGDAHRAANAAVAGETAPVHRRAAVGAPLRQPATAPAAGPAAKPASPPKPQREERLNVGRGGGRVDAELDRAVGWLTVKMKLKFEPVNKPLPWPSPARFAEFQTKFVDTVSKRWSFKHYLVPAAPCPGEPQLVSVRLQLVPVTSGEHARVNVGYTTEFQRSRAGKGIAELDVLDVDRRDDYPQTPAEHEFGHMLGLSHIHCAADDDDCYGTNSTEKADIMGRGSFVSPRDYEPFAELMPYFTGCNYNVRPASQIPTSRAPDIGGAIGFLAGGIGLGLAGAAIGGLLGPVGAIVGGLVGMVGGAIGGYFAGRALATPSVPS